ncbi:MAG: N-acetylmuramoyl-L-alanine amidase [Pseudomonadota bacterium]
MAKQTIFISILILVLSASTSSLPAKTLIQTTQKTIALDPGHGGEDFGLVSTMGIQEKTIVLQLAQRTAHLIEGRYNVLLTRSQDITIMPSERMFLANQNQADLFISLHLNTSQKPLAFGYYFDSPDFTQHQPDLKDTRWKSLPLRHTTQSKAAGKAFLNIFSTQQTPIRFHLNGAPIRVLEGALMPAILIEPFPISMLPQDSNDLVKLLDQYALLISKSIDLYFNKKQN